MTVLESRYGYQPIQAIPITYGNLEMHRINNKWYIYFAADDGNMDNHQIYVIENEADIPTEGKFVMKGRIPTDKDNNWAIHASTFEHNGQRYMIWCGWQKTKN